MPEVIPLMSNARQAVMTVATSKAAVILVEQKGYIDCPQTPWSWGIMSGSATCGGSHRDARIAKRMIDKFEGESV
jgi:hypothetical protein